MLLTKFAVTAVLLISTVLAAPEAPIKIRLRMKGVKRDASHIANYYLPASSHSYHQHQHGGLSGAQHLQVLDVKLPQAGGHYVPSYAIPSKSYESTAHHFPSHTPHFSHTGQQYVLSGSHGADFAELAKALGGQVSSGAGAGSSGHVSFGGASASGHGYAASAAPSYSYASQSLGHQAASLGGHQASSLGGYQAASLGGHQSSSLGGYQASSLGGYQSAGQGGYSFASIPQTSGAEASKTGPISFGDQSAGHIQQQLQLQQQQPAQQQSFGGHQFGFVAASGHEQQQAAPQIQYIPQPQAQALTSSLHGASLGPQTQNTPVYAIGMKGLGHYATGNHFGQGASSASSGLGHSFGGLSYGSGAHGGYYLDTSALKGLNLGGKFVIMSKPTALTYGHSYPQAQQYPKYSFPSTSYSSGSLSSAGGYKSAAPFKPSVFLGATQESVAEYEHGNYAQEAASGSSSSGYSSGAEYKFASPSASSVSYGSSGIGGH